MTELDKALNDFQQDMKNPETQSRFYDLFLNAIFYVPTLDEADSAEEKSEQGHVVPLIIEAEGKDYLMLFATEERLRTWAQTEVSFVQVAGHVLAATSSPPMHWALNVGSEPSKMFLPDEIAWLREVVERCDANEEKDRE